MGRVPQGFWHLGFDTDNWGEEETRTSYSGPVSNVIHLFGSSENFYKDVRIIGESSMGGRLIDYKVLWDRKLTNATGMWYKVSTNGKVVEKTITMEEFMKLHKEYCENYRGGIDRY